MASTNFNCRWNRYKENETFLCVERAFLVHVENELLEAAVALHLNRRIHSFAALNSWTGGSLTDLNSWTELYLNRRQRR